MNEKESIKVLEKAVKVLTGNDPSPKLNFEATAKAIQVIIDKNKKLEENIPRDKIKEKIEEYKKMSLFEIQDKLPLINLLQELLEERN